MIADFAEGETIGCQVNGKEEAAGADGRPTRSIQMVAGGNSQRPGSSSARQSDILKRPDFLSDPK